MNHTDTRCDRDAAASALALRWRCPVCGNTAIMKVSKAVFTLRRILFWTWSIPQLL
jgi:predicted RNA-binding Zn-ribbon protein involved in translation (DUF1610 family)